MAPCQRGSWKFHTNNQKSYQDLCRCWNELERRDEQILEKLPSNTSLHNRSGASHSTVQSAHPNQTSGNLSSGRGWSRKQHSQPGWGAENGDGKLCRQRILRETIHVTGWRYGAWEDPNIRDEEISTALRNETTPSRQETRIHDNSSWRWDTRFRYKKFIIRQTVRWLSWTRSGRSQVAARNTNDQWNGDRWGFKRNECER